MFTRNTAIIGDNPLMLIRHFTCCSILCFLKKKKKLICIILSIIRILSNKNCGGSSNAPRACLIKHQKEVCLYHHSVPVTQSSATCSRDMFLCFRNTICTALVNWMIRKRQAIIHCVCCLLFLLLIYKIKWTKQYACMEKWTIVQKINVLKHLLTEW